MSPTTPQDIDALVDRVTERTQGTAGDPLTRPEVEQVVKATLQELLGEVPNQPPDEVPEAPPPPDVPAPDPPPAPTETPAGDPADPEAAQQPS